LRYSIKQLEKVAKLGNRK